MTNKMQLCRTIYYFLAALHISNDIFAHHQEHLNCITASGITRFCHYRPTFFPDAKDKIPIGARDTIPTVQPVRIKFKFLMYCRTTSRQLRAIQNVLCTGVFLPAKHFDAHLSQKHSANTEKNKIY